MKYQKILLYIVSPTIADLKIIWAVKNAIYELNSYEKLFSLERWEVKQ